MDDQSKSPDRMRSIGRTPESRKWSKEICRKGSTRLRCSARASEVFPELDAPLSRIICPDVHVGIVIAFETLVVTLGARQAARGWYRRVLQNPDVKVTRAGEPLRYVAVPVLGKERERVAGDYRLPWAVRFLTGFPPRSFLRLDRMPTT